MTSDSTLIKTQEGTLDSFLRYSLPEKEKRATAVRALLDRFHSVERVLSAEGEDLAAVPGVGEKAAMFLKLIPAIQTRTVTEKYVPGKKFSDAELVDCLTALLSAESVECVYMAMTDAAGVFLGAECVGRGSVNSSNVTVRRFLEIAARHRASRVILAHNHPSGLPTPSPDDLNVTVELLHAFASVGITLADHYVIAENVAESIFGRTAKGRFV